MDTPNWRQILGGTAGVALLGTIGYFGQARIQTSSSPSKFVSSKSKKAPAVEANNFAEPSSNVPEGDFNVPDAPKKFKIDVSGEVVKPGVYEVTEGARIEDVIKLAGGLKENADGGAVNMAMKLKDEQKVVVPPIRVVYSEPLAQDVKDPFNTGRSSSPSPTIQTPSTAAGATHARSNKKPPPAHPISINSATEAELLALPGVGPGMAKKIVDYRSSKGPFADVEELRKVKGIGEKVFAKLRPWITL